MVASSGARAVGTAGDPEIERVRTFARVFDRYGLDAIIGLVLPGIGDVIGSLLGLYIVGIALRRKVSTVVVVRMLINLGLDLLIGVVPVVGDIADFAFRANEKNLALLEARSAGGPARASDWAMLAAVVLGFVAVLGALGYAVIALVRAIGGS
jgi:uncharacterized protein DUF4112